MGICLITAALVILIAAFNGIEGMVAQLYSDYDADITVRSALGKTFKETTIDLKKLKNSEHVIHVNRAVEEIVILKQDKKWANARMVGVDAPFIQDCNMGAHILEGHSSLEENGEPTGIIGAGILQKIGGYISDVEGGSELMIYTPLREAPVVFHKSPFKVTPLWIVGTMNYNREVNDNELIVPLDFARLQLDYEDDLTALYISLDKSADPEEVKAILQKKVGNNFIVKTAAEKNELIFKTSKSEKRIVIIILVFVFLLAAFNLIASLTMLFIEKSENIQTLYRIGMTQKSVFRIFFTEGLLISARGIIIGLAIGIGVCLFQMYYPVLEMPNSDGRAFPIALSFGDGLMIFGLVSTLSILTSCIPVWFLVYRSGR